jgi:hypothetical protein
VSDPCLEEIELMHPMDHQPFSSPEWVFEFKYDGYRVLASNDRLLTRQKKDATTWFPEIAEPLQKLRGSFIIDGEICLLDAKGVPNFEVVCTEVIHIHRAHGWSVYDWSVVRGSNSFEADGRINWNSGRCPFQRNMSNGQPIVPDGYKGWRPLPPGAS